MANPQKENGYTSISNELLEAIYRRKFSASQLKIIIFIIRFTYGFNRKTASLSNSFISSGTGIHEITVSKEVSALLKDNVLKLYKKPSFHSSRVIGINKDYEGWRNHLELASALTLSERSLRVSETANFELAKPLTKKDNIQRQNIKKEKERAVLSDDVFSDSKIQYNDDGTYIDEKGYPRLPNGELDEDNLTPQQKLELRIF